MKIRALLVVALVLAAQQRLPDTILKEIGALIDEYRAQGLPIVVADGGDFAKALAAAPVGGTIVLAGTVTGNFILAKQLRVEGGRVITPNNSPALTIPGNDVDLVGTYIGIAPVVPGGDLVVVTGNRVTFTDAVIEGNFNTKRGCACNGANISFLRTIIRGIGKFGQETQALAMWDGPGPLTVQWSTFSGGSTSILIGGAQPTIPNLVPADILVEDSTLTRDEAAMRGKGFSVKTGFELKTGRRVIVRRTLIENVWVDGQTGWAVTLTPVNYVNSPETVIEDVLFDDNDVRHVAGGANILGLSQQTGATQRLHNVEFRGSRWATSRSYAGGGQGALMQLGREPYDLRWVGNTATLDGDAIIRVTDTRVLLGFAFTGNTVTGGSAYGIFSAAGRQGGAWFATQFPDGVITGNTLPGMNAIFKAYFPANTY